MVIELHKYKNIQPTVKSMLENNFNRGHVDLVANMAVACNCPVIACCFYYAKELGYLPDETRNQISNLIKFYKYTQINGIKELGVPFEMEVE